MPVIRNVYCIVVETLNQSYGWFKISQGFEKAEFEFRFHGPSEPKLSYKKKEENIYLLRLLSGFRELIQIWI